MKKRITGDTSRIQVCPTNILKTFNLNQFYRRNIFSNQGKQFFFFTFHNFQQKGLKYDFQI